ncbi:MAG: agmatine deiminase family protein [Bdellovibrionales bacterium]|nr:agmatine deiminase family protein [Bdellovibrionales bacterium]
MNNELVRRMPAEWEPHAATWIAWPHEESDWPGKFQTIPWVYTEIVRVLSRSEMVHVLCKSTEAAQAAETLLKLSGVTENYRLHVCTTDRSWLRDSAPTAVISSSQRVELVAWQFNAWAKYSNYALDQEVPSFISNVTSHSLVRAVRPDNGLPFVLEGGSIDTDGQGTLLTTEECLLSEIQNRNPGMSKTDYEEAFERYLGVTQVIWLGRGCAGDDTHGHVDDIARFVAPGRVIAAVEEDPSDENYEPLQENLYRLRQAQDAHGRPLEVIELPMPRCIAFEGTRLPASYANFYIANSTVVVPLFNDENDIRALELIQSCFPTRKAIGIYCGDLILGLGTLHCLTQQEPRAN